jgi:hypothetical protein
LNAEEAKLALNLKIDIFEVQKMKIEINRASSTILVLSRFQSAPATNTFSIEC